ncbi:MAG: exosome complex protein Rrp42 [Candidatus Aenigmarchaeota archaeon]|nr:exosome complex protein Rrp42 [Candidatus Aenigmarchaeota archaeon]
MLLRNKSYVKKMAEDQIRVDGRKLDEFREIKIEKDVIKSAEGSAKVTIGNTVVLAGVKIGIGEPFPDTPDEGILMVGAELSPVASPEFEPGPPGPDAIELARIVDRGIRESHCIELNKLVIKEGEQVYMINIDIHILNHDGNLIDAAGLAAIAALIDAKLPKVEDGKIILDEKIGNVPVVDKPISITTVKISNTLMLDTTADEWDSLDARLTITTNNNGDICAVQKGGEGYFTLDEIKKAVDFAIKYGKELRKIL